MDNLQHRRTEMWVSATPLGCPFPVSSSAGARRSDLGHQVSLWRIFGLVHTLLQTHRGYLCPTRIFAGSLLRRLPIWNLVKKLNWWTFRKIFESLPSGNLILQHISVVADRKVQKAWKLKEMFIFKENECRELGYANLSLSRPYTVIQIMWFFFYKC